MTPTDAYVDEIEGGWVVACDERTPGEILTPALPLEEAEFLTAYINAEVRLAGQCRDFAGVARLLEAVKAVA
jgi:hypothetical protein